MWGFARALAAALVVAAGLTQASVAQGKISDARAQQLEKDLGEKSAGIYYDKDDDNIVVTVTDEASAKKARAAGAIARIVSRSRAKLDSVNVGLRKKIRTAGTSWGIDPVENKVVFTFDASLDADERAKIRDILESVEDSVRIESTGGTFRPFLSGGDAIRTSSGSRCSLGFNVLKGGVQHLLTAGHCGNISPSWTIPGTVVGSSFPGNDYAIIKYTSTTPTRPGDVDLYNGTFQDITAAANPVVGRAVKKSGSTTRVTSGTVMALNTTVNYPQGTVTGVIRTNVCAEPGDSGGALFAGAVAHGLVSGGSGNCTSGGTTFFQPVLEALAVYSATIY